MPGIHLILVDDDDLMLRMLEPALPELEIQPRIATVQTAADPKRALAAIAQAPLGPLVILTDFNLKAPQNGIDVLRVAARDRPECVRILMSGYAADQIGDVSDGGLIHGFLEKPLRLHDLYGPLVQLIQTHLKLPR